jgi:hypothetical protein
MSINLLSLYCCNDATTKNTTMSNIKYIYVGYKKSSVTTINNYIGGSAIKVEKIGATDFFVESRRVDTPTMNNVLKMDFIRIYKIINDLVIVGAFRTDGTFKKSPYYD